MSHPNLLSMATSPSGNLSVRPVTVVVIPDQYAYVLVLHSRVSAARSIPFSSNFLRISSPVIDIMDGQTRGDSNSSMSIFSPVSNVWQLSYFFSAFQLFWV